MRYLAILLACSVVYIGSRFTPDVEGAYFFVVQALFSVFLVHFVLYVSNSWLAFSIAILETYAVFLNLLAYLGYITGFEFFYLNYEYILDAINCSEAVALLIGAPGNGLFIRLSDIWRSIHISITGRKLHH